jgi:hypothetical protein
MVSKARPSIGRIIASLILTLALAWLSLRAF